MSGGDVGDSLKSIKEKVDEGIASIRKMAKRECKAFVRLSSRGVFQLTESTVENTPQNYWYSWQDTKNSMSTYFKYDPRN